MSCKHYFINNVVEGIHTGKLVCSYCGIIKKYGESIERPEVTQRVIDGFAAILDSQDKKGIEKYGRTIDEAEDQKYDWKLMALEEAADLQKYNVKEIMRLEKEVDRFKIQLEMEKAAHASTTEMLTKEIEMLKQEREQFKTEAAMWHKQSKARLEEMRELQWRNIDLQNEVAALKEDIVTQTAFEKVLKERDEFKKAWEIMGAAIEALKVAAKK